MKRLRKKRVIVTIDGPAGAGKSTVSKLLARKLKYLYLDTGAMYRAVAVRVCQEGIDPEDDPALERLCRGLDISFRVEGEEQRVICQGEDVTEKIREPQIGRMASSVSMRRPVREAMVSLQRKIAFRRKIVAEGRDTGTVVFPDADYKFYLVAAPEERALRRHREMAAKGIPWTLEEVKKEMKERDEQDAGRDLAPLRPAEDARLIDSTNLTPEEVVEIMLQMMDPEG